MVQAIAAGLGGVQAIAGGIQAISGNRRLKRLMNQREVYRTQDEVFDAFNLATNQAQTGYDAGTMKYLTSQNDRALSGSLGALTRLGGDPNDVASIFDASMQNIMRIGAEDQALRMQKLNKVFEGLQGIAQGKDAEYTSRETLLKDKMAMEAQKVEAGMKNLQSGLQLGLNALANKEAEELYKEANGLTGSKKLVKEMGKTAIEKPIYDYYRPNFLPEEYTV